MTASQNQSLLDDLFAYPQPSSAANPPSEPASGAQSAFKKQTLAQLIPKQGRQPPGKNSESAHTSTATTPGVPSDGQKVKQMIKIVNKQNQQKQQQASAQHKPGAHQRQNTKVSLNQDGALAYQQPPVLPPTPHSAGMGLREQNSAQNIGGAGNQTKSQKRSHVATSTAQNPGKAAASQGKKVGGLPITDFAKAL